MSDRKDDKTAPPQAAQPDDDDRTVMFTPDDLAAAQAAAQAPGAAVDEDDADRTVMFSREDLAAVQAAAEGGGHETIPPDGEPNLLSPEEEDPDRTVMFTPEDLAAVQAAAQNSAATPPTQAPAPAADIDDADRTVMFSPDDIAKAQGQAAAIPGGDDDGFGGPMMAPPVARPSAPTPPPVDDDDDRTIITTAGPRPAPGAVVTGTGSGATFTENPRYQPPVAGAIATPLTTLETGTVINNMYRVEESLDQGGMGRVFRGVEIGTGEAVAIKVILPEMAEDDKVAQMFRREARTLRQLHHDAIVRYFAYVPPDQNMNLHALVMGFIQGTKLSDKLAERGGLSQSEVVKLTMRLADGLERAHQIGVVHRDLSPDNVMLPDGDIEKAVLIDFGISRSSAVPEGTIGNEFAGKLKYVSPEQLGLYGGDAEGQSDVYSLGLLMMAMITGKPVPMGSSIADAVQKRQGLPDLSTMPLEFRDLLSEMLQPNPTDRTGSMQEVIDHLSAFDGATTGLGTRRGARPLIKDRAVPGLQAVPSAAHGGVTKAPGDNTTKAELAKATKKKGGVGFIAALVVVAGLAGGGYFAFGDQIQEMLAANAPEPAPTGADAVTAGLLRQPDSRATFLAEAVPGPCNFATRRSAGASAGVIEAFGVLAGPLRGLGSVFGEAYGLTPEVLTRTVPEAMCPVVDFAWTFQGTAGSGIEMSLSANVLPRTEGVVGTLQGSAGRQNFLALVDPNGRMFSLMRQLEDPIGEERRFAFRLSSATPGVYMLISTASDSPLVRAGAMQDGVPSADFLPLLTRELAADGQGAVDIAYVELTR